MRLSAKRLTREQINLGKTMAEMYLGEKGLSENTIKERMLTVAIIYIVIGAANSKKVKVQKPI